MQFRIPVMLLAAVLTAGPAHPAAAQSSVVKSALSQASPTHSICTGEAEKNLVRMRQTAERVDLTSWRNRDIRGACLNSLITAGDKGRPLRIIGANVVDSLIVDFSDVTIAVFLERTTFQGEVRFANSRFRWDVVLSGSTFDTLVDLSGASFDADLIVHDAVFNDTVNGYHMRVGGDLEAMRAQFRDHVDFRGVHVKGEAKFDGITAQSFDASRGLFEGDVVFTNSWFVGPNATLDLERATIKQSLFLDELDTAAPVVNLVYAEVGYSLGAHWTVWADSVNMRGMQTGMHLDLRYGTFTDRVILQAARVGGDLKLDSIVATRGAAIHQAQVTRNLSLRGADFRDFLSLAESHAGLLNITDLRGVPSSRAFLVDGLTFGHIESLNNGTDDPTALIAFLDSASFSADAYGTLEGFFANHGNRRFANKTLFKRRERERGTRPWYLNVGSWVLNGTVRYGRWPALAFVWWAGFVGFGTLVFSRARPTLVDRQKTSCPAFDPFWYSLDTFLPMVDLKYADDWKLRRSQHRKAWIYLRWHTLAGWVLIPIALAAISGLMK